MSNALDKNLINLNELFKLDPKRFSDWTRLKRMYAWVYRFLENCRAPKEKRSLGELEVSEIQDAEILIVQNAQKEFFSAEYTALSKKKDISTNSKLLKLRPWLDETGVIRCEGRLNYADYLPYSARYPIILPKHCWVTTLIVKHFHEKLGHHGVNQVLAAISSCFWIISGREAIKEWQSKCTTCIRQKAKPAKQLMSALPEIRLKLPLKAFVRVAVDFAGPFATIQGRGKRRAKRYLCLFTCLVSRAVHLEMAYGLDTNSFLNAFFRMADRRGVPQEMLSDNAGNFTAADKELKELCSQFDKKRLKKCFANNNVKWSFIPPTAPHFGGVHEAMIKSAKKAIKAILSTV